VTESLIPFYKITQKPYVEVEAGIQKFTGKCLILGVSDEIYVEINSGIEASDNIKV